MKGISISPLVVMISETLIATTSSSGARKVFFIVISSIYKISDFTKSNVLYHLMFFLSTVLKKKRIFVFSIAIFTNLMYNIYTK